MISAASDHSQFDRQKMPKMQKCVREIEMSAGGVEDASFRPVAQHLLHGLCHGLRGGVVLEGERFDHRGARKHILTDMMALHLGLRPPDPYFRAVAGTRRRRFPYGRLIPARYRLEIRRNPCRIFQAIPTTKFFLSRIFFINVFSLIVFYYGYPIRYLIRYLIRYPIRYPIRYLIIFCFGFQ